MFKIVQSVVICLSLISLGNISFAQKMQTVEGEVLDMVCFMAHEGKGPKHKTCAQKCVNEGAAVGLVTSDGKVYLVIENHHKKAAYQQVKKLAAEKVKITGPIYTKGGVQAIEAESVEKL
ncbi:MAG: hypothetical protein HYW85_04360 [Deltaproteobacteria bacterium]|nr:hypothetical protein [Deltaproteobacteria bacterium]MBI3017169.1 hypothetical protein [Deltaproteobacteria bacterium]